MRSENLQGFAGSDYDIRVCQSTILEFSWANPSNISPILCRCINTIVSPDNGGDNDGDASHAGYNCIKPLPTCVFVHRLAEIPTYLHSPRTLRRKKKEEEEDYPSSASGYSVQTMT
jgi:hypothetical protein